MKGLEMSRKAKQHRVADDMVQGMKEAVEFVRGTTKPSGYRVHIPAEMDVAAIRKGLGMTQSEFANHYGFTLARVRDWEQGRSCPDGAMRAFLVVIGKHPKTVNKALRAASEARALVDA
jgi:putative transcriptional regulator